MSDRGAKDACCAPVAGIDPAWRRALWVAMFANGGMSIAETVFSLWANSSSLQADAIDFLGDTINYAISLGVASLALAWRARVAVVKGATLIIMGLAVLAVAGWRLVVGGAMPQPATMGVIAIVALVVNVGVALLLFRFRTGDANMRSVWICSRNDAIGNIAILIAALGVFGSGTMWPDLVVALVMAALGISGGLSIIRSARRELKQVRHTSDVVRA